MLFLFLLLHSFRLGFCLVGQRCCVVLPESIKIVLCGNKNPKIMSQLSQAPGYSTLSPLRTSTGSKHSESCSTFITEGVRIVLYLQYFLHSISIPWLPNLKGL